MLAISSQTGFFAGLLLLALGATGSLVLSKNDRLANYWGNSMAILASICGLYSSVAIIFYGEIFSYAIKSSFPLLSFSFTVDKLSAFFILVISLIALLSSVYGLGYAKHFFKKYNLGSLGFFYNLFIAGMLMVVAAGNALFFLIVWEIMSLASYFLVIFENKEEKNIKAGSLYFIMTHIGTAFILLSFLLLFKATGTFDFVAIKASLGGISPALKNAVFILALIGFGTKAGIIPFHIWLPSAHPAAPTHVSALMSGVMIKTGIYMFIRIFIDILPGAPTWWGVVILMAGAISALLGVLYALTEHDIKKLLAYHSIENIGIILLGLGSSLVFLSLGFKALAMLGLAAALFHTLNHAIFKALLFMGAGSVISKMHTRNMEEYGGLIKYMPQTAFFFLIGAMAISALPPFNGFFSEWLTYQALFNGILGLDSFFRWPFVLAVGSLALTGGLAAACFVKAFGITFLARPRSEEVKQASEVALSMRLGMGALALLTLVVGFFAGNLSGFFIKIISGLEAFKENALPYSAGLTGVAIGNFSFVSMPAILAIILVSVAAVSLVIYLLAKNRRVKIGRTWDCGSDLDPRMEITATGFSRSIIMIFKNVLKPSQQTSIEYKDSAMRYFPEEQNITLETEDVYGEYLYQPAKKLIAKISEQVKQIQTGNLNIYVLYIFVILIVLLLVL